MATAIMIAFGGKPGPEYFDAIAETQEEAEDAEYSFMADTEEAKILERLKRD